MNSNIMDSTTPNQSSANKGFEHNFQWLREAKKPLSHIIQRSGPAKVWWLWRRRSDCWSPWSLNEKLEHHFFGCGKWRKNLWENLSTYCNSPAKGECFVGNLEMLELRHVWFPNGSWSLTNSGNHWHVEGDKKRRSDQWTPTTRMCEPGTNRNGTIKQSTWGHNQEIWG